MNELVKEPIRWDYILSQIQQEKCILMIGPELVPLPQKEPIHLALKKYLEEKQGRELPYFSEDEFFAFKNRGDKHLTYFDIREFFEKIPPNKTYQQLAKIPFHLTISLSPDDLLKQSMKSLGLPFRFDYYKKGVNPKALQAPSKSDPILYNLLGSIEDETSLVYCYDDLFDYLECLFGEYKLPKAIRSSIKAHSNLIFLGISYNKWYLRLLLRLLGLKNERVKDACSKADELENQQITFYTKHFNINFIEKDVAEFVDILYQKCESANQLRSNYEPKRQAKEHNQRSELIKLISSGKAEEVIQILESYLETHSEFLYEKLILLSSRHRKLSSKKMSGIIKPEDAIREEAIIENSLIKMIKEVHQEI